MKIQLRLEANNSFFKMLLNSQDHIYCLAKGDELKSGIKFSCTLAEI